MSRHKITTVNIEIIYISDNKVLSGAEAALRIAEDTGGILKFFAVFRIFPLKLREYIYRFIAERRYRIAGKRDSCYMVVDKKEKSKDKT